MERRTSQNDHSPPHVSNDVRKARGRSRDVNNSDDYTPVRETYLRKNEEEWVKKRPPRADREMSKYEDYLRNKWGCNDAIPDSFDPDKLDAALKSARSRQQLSTKTHEHARPRQPENEAPRKELQAKHQDEPSSSFPVDAPSSFAEGSSHSDYSCRCNASTHADEQDTNYDSEASISHNEHATEENTPQARGRSRSNAISRHRRTPSETKERPPTPRIRSGSKPPLSRSAFVAGGVPCEDERCQGQCKREAHKRAKAPAYFPFKSRARGSSRSGGSAGSQTP